MATNSRKMVFFTRISPKQFKEKSFGSHVCISIDIKVCFLYLTVKFPVISALIGANIVGPRQSEKREKKGQQDMVDKGQRSDAY